MIRASIDLTAITDGLVEVKPGLWQGNPEGKLSYPEQGYDASLQLETSSYWYEHRNACILSAVRRFPPSGTLFDIGGGNGYVTQSLVSAGFDAVVVEPAPRGAHNAWRRGLEPVVCASFDRVFRPAILPAVGVFDVIEHVEDDESFLQTIAERLQPGGRLYLTVPAGPWLWSDNDREAGHWRRYTRSELLDKVSRAGFHVEWCSAFFAPLVVPILLLRTIPSRLRLRKILSYEREFKAPTGGLGRLLRRALAWELARFHHRHQRLGSSLLLVASRD